VTPKRHALTTAVTKLAATSFAVPKAINPITGTAKHAALNKPEAIQRNLRIRGRKNDSRDTTRLRDLASSACVAIGHDQAASSGCRCRGGYRE
jgi:hypothetical protein